jgi:hypothetical protein
MYLHQTGRVVTSASDLTSATGCEFSWLRRLDHKLGRIDQVPRSEDLMLARAAKLGEVHEVRILNDYDDGVGTVVRVAKPNLRRRRSSRSLHWRPRRRRKCLASC